jgi:hypothetical protein
LNQQEFGLDVNELINEKENESIEPSIQMNSDSIQGEKMMKPVINEQFDSEVVENDENFFTDKTFDNEIETKFKPKYIEYESECEKPNHTTNGSTIETQPETQILSEVFDTIKSDSQSNKGLLITKQEPNFEISYDSSENECQEPIVEVIDNEEFSIIKDKELSITSAEVLTEALIENEKNSKELEEKYNIEKEDNVSKIPSNETDFKNESKNRSNVTNEGQPQKLEENMNDSNDATQIDDKLLVSDYTKIEKIPINEVNESEFEVENDPKLQNLKQIKDENVDEFQPLNEKQGNESSAEKLTPEIKTGNDSIEDNTKLDINDQISDNLQNDKQSEGTQIKKKRKNKKKRKENVNALDDITSKNKIKYELNEETDNKKSEAQEFIKTTNPNEERAIEKKNNSTDIPDKEPEVEDENEKPDESRIDPKISQNEIKKKIKKRKGKGKTLKEITIKPNEDSNEPNFERGVEMNNELEIHKNNASIEKINEKENKIQETE